VANVAAFDVGKQPEEKYPWGAIRWLMSGKMDPGAQQTFGVVRIDAGKSNALHLHPNCEELLYVLSGTGTTRVDNKTIPLRPGELVRVPMGVLHQATASASGPLVAVISYSSGDRQVVRPGTSPE
jgi:mannose-6-phosphate isomerase-like protein (cupin superfamily)